MVFLGILKFKHLVNRGLMRWAIAAHDICFTRKSHALFFAFGKSIPVVRGNGIFQVSDKHWLFLYREMDF